ncbi:MAG TPA: hypothetical protein VL326_07885 [Kofleriaceae bacterium]|nr:hypothetical protein [Kofleriaceae bacterium]
MDIEERAETVSSREQFVAFLQAFEQDFRAYGANWENATLDSFVEALAAWTSVSDRYYANRGEQIANMSPWRIIADGFMAARIYE